MQPPTRLSTTRVHDLLFADECALNTVTAEDMQRSMDIFAKSVVMHQLPPSTKYNAPRIEVNSAQLENVEIFAKLGSML
ncbi:unnamed protein product [Schistocephalus solidus]|uniref:Reverse transcriptase domain-containing protein n=1 Tax=Schistocephalus solidus TaxID=70667 RepID=A0A183T6A8_SCHSO|nr:unnamed protein product [Schistocephalus solidus]